MGAVVKGGYGGGIPVVAFWTRTVGEAIGHVETVPLYAFVARQSRADGRVNAATRDSRATRFSSPVKPILTPRTFLAVYSGDFYEPLRMWSSVLQKEGWTLTKPSPRPTT